MLHKNSQSKTKWKKSIKAPVASIIVFKLLNENSSNPTNQLEIRISQSLIFPKNYLVKIKLIYDT